MYILHIKVVSNVIKIRIIAFSYIKELLIRHLRNWNVVNVFFFSSINQVEYYKKIAGLSLFLQEHLHFCFSFLFPLIFFQKRIVLQLKVVIFVKHGPYKRDPFFQIQYTMINQCRTLNIVAIVYKYPVWDSLEKIN